MHHLWPKDTIIYPPTQNGWTRSNAWYVTSLNMQTYGCGCSLSMFTNPDRLIAPFSLDGGWITSQRCQSHIRRYESWWLESFSSHTQRYDRMIQRTTSHMYCIAHVLLKCLHAVTIGLTSDLVLWSQMIVRMHGDCNRQVTPHGPRRLLLLLELLAIVNLSTRNTSPTLLLPLQHLQHIHQYQCPPLLTSNIIHNLIRQHNGKFKIWCRLHPNYRFYRGIESFYTHHTRSACSTEKTMMMRLRWLASHLILLSCTNEHYSLNSIFYFYSWSILPFTIS